MVTHGGLPSSPVQQSQRELIENPALFLHHYNHCLLNPMASLPSSDNTTGATARPADTEDSFASDRAVSRTKSTVRNVRQELIDFLTVLQKEGGTVVEFRYSHSMSRISYRHGDKDSVGDEEVYKLPRSHAAWNDIEAVFSSKLESGKKYTANVQAVIKALEAGWRKGEAVT